MNTGGCLIIIESGALGEEGREHVFSRLDLIHSRGNRDHAHNQLLTLDHEDSSQIAN